MMAETQVNTQEDTLAVQNIPVPPQIKTSNEILCELFGAFNATPPVLENIKEENIQKSSSNKSNAKHKKHSKKKLKKGKKKKRSSSSDSKSLAESKKKTKKSKKEKTKKHRSDSESDNLRKNKKRKLGKFSASDSDDDEDGHIVKKKKHSKEKSNNKRSPEEKLKIKQEKSDSKNSKSSVSLITNSIKEEILKDAVSKIVDKVIDSTSFDITLPKTSTVQNKQSCKMVSEVVGEHSMPVFKQENLEVKKRSVKEELSSKDSNNACKDVNQEALPDNHVERSTESKNNSSADNLATNKSSVPLNVADVFAEDLMECGIQKDNSVQKEKPKPLTGKITIKNLKFSQVYEDTVKQIEEEARQKAEKYEEGELSDSSPEEERSPTPSEASSFGSDKKLGLDRKENSHKHHHKRDRHRHRRHHRSHDQNSEEKSKHRARKDGTHSHHRHKERRRTHSRDRSRSRSRERTRGRSLDRDGSRDRRTERTRAHSKEKHRSRERSDKERSKSRERIRSKSRERKRSKSRERNRSKDRLKKDKPSDRNEKHRSKRVRSRERDRRKSEEIIDKRKLLEIARKNALNMMKNPSGGVMEETKVVVTAGGRTVNELTNFCKLLSKKDADGHESISSNTSHSSDSETEKVFHHPFQLKDRPSNIVLNIRNSVALPVKSLQEKTAEQSKQLRLQFPVSSGQQHRTKESEWIPVSPKKTESVSSTTNTQVAVIKPTKHTKALTDTPQSSNVDVGSIVTQRLVALRKLQENPGDCEALSQMYKAQKNMQNWAESKQEPLGQFTGSTGVRVLSQAELASGGQAWARRVGIALGLVLTAT